MSGRIRQASNCHRTRLDSGWSLCRTAAGAVPSPAHLDAIGDAAWIRIDAPGTVADGLRRTQHWSLDGPAQRFDADDWWFRLRFDVAEGPADARRDLSFGGLAGLAEVWLNREPLLTSTDMHVAHSCAEPALQRTGNELLLRFASLDAWLAKRRPRPRWRVPMVEHQQLRWARTTLLGRTPGWSPPAAPVGPWRDIEIVETRRLIATGLRLGSRVEGPNGVVTVAIELAALAPANGIESAQLELERDGATQRAPLRADARVPAHHSASLVVPSAALWWPHTHGAPALYDARIAVRLAGGGEPVVIDLGRIGFRSVALATEGGDFALRINGVLVFCRGACWTPLDIVSLRSTPQACQAALEQVRDAGMNMLRVSGAMVYEDAHFLDACDALGIMVWQDFMFANMDFPADDEDFARSVRVEVEQQLACWQARPALTVLCGNSEAEQQAAMWGSPRDTWSQPLFDRDLAELAAGWCPDVPYWPSSAHAGAFPHQNDSGTTSYYGVGAYLRPLDDARRAGLRFATECLGFANVPPDTTLARMPGGAGLRSHHPLWKARSPRDLGAGWDFDDVRDHYLQRLYRVDPVALRSTDPARYLTLSRAVGTELMAATFSEWRRPASTCRGALVWFLRDLWAGAGWGVLDDQGVPKAAFHGLRRAFAPIALFISDEGTNGLALHVVNEPDRALAATVEVALYRDDGLRMQHAVQTHAVAARGALSLPMAQWFDEFIDCSRAYRFGPAEHAVIVATLRAGAGPTIAQTFHFPEGLPNQRERDVGLSAQARMHADGSAALTLRTRGFAQSIHFDLPDFIAQDEYFHLAPMGERTVRLVPRGAGAQPVLRGDAFALNAWAGASIKVEA